DGGVALPRHGAARRASRAHARAHRGSRGARGRRVLHRRSHAQHSRPLARARAPERRLLRPEERARLTGRRAPGGSLGPEDIMTLVRSRRPDGPTAVPGPLTERGVVSIADTVLPSPTPQLTMQKIIDHFETLRPSLERIATKGHALPLADVRLRAPIPRPG